MPIWIMEAWEKKVERTKPEMGKVSQIHKESKHKTESVSKLHMKLKGFNK